MDSDDVERLPAKFSIALFFEPPPPLEVCRDNLFFLDIGPKTDTMRFLDRKVRRLIR